MDKVVWIPIDTHNLAYLESNKRFTINRVSDKFELYDRLHPNNLTYYDSLQLAKEEVQKVYDEG